MFGISGGELLVILVIAAFVLGPKNVAQAVVGLRKLLDKVREFSARVRKETTMDMGSLGFDSSDVEKLRNLKLSDYDPREMVRQAVREEMDEWVKATSGAGNSMQGAAGAGRAGAQQAAMPHAPAHPTAAASGSAASGPAVSVPAANQAGAPVQPQVPAQPQVAAQPQDPVQPQDAPSGPARYVSSGTPDYLAGGASHDSNVGEHQADGPLDLNTILNRPDLGGSR